MFSFAYRKQLLFTPCRCFFYGKGKGGMWVRKSLLLPPTQISNALRNICIRNGRVRASFLLSLKRTFRHERMPLIEPLWPRVDEANAWHLAMYLSSNQTSSLPTSLFYGREREPLYGSLWGKKLLKKSMNFEHGRLC